MLDTSGLVKYYHTETGSQNVQAIVDNSNNVLFISTLTLVEIHSAFARKVRTQEISSEVFQLVRRKFYADLLRRKFHILRITHHHEWQAIHFLVNIGLQKHIRTLDAIQLSVATDLKRRGQLDYFVCADERFCQTVHEEGIAVVNPEIEESRN